MSWPVFGQQDTLLQQQLAPAKADRVHIHLAIPGLNHHRGWHSQCIAFIEYSGQVNRCCLSTPDVGWFPFFPERQPSLA
ncbi:hypothetical protein, partial [Rhizobium bangladeshense]|uniref:hypothetical protein n=1 Tax=Rhizobium bangladeshense TaxID=1138189 RepID=UPI001AECE9CC